MSHKKAKRIRREIGYHPNQKRVYVKSKSGVIEIAPDNNRALYLAMKKDS